MDAANNEECDVTFGGKVEGSSTLSVITVSDSLLTEVSPQSDIPLSLVEEVVIVVDQEDVLPPENPALCVEPLALGVLEEAPLMLVEPSQSSDFVEEKSVELCETKGAQPVGVYVDVLAAAAEGKKWFDGEMQACWRMMRVIEDSNRRDRNCVLIPRTTRKAAGFLVGLEDHLPGELENQRWWVSLLKWVTATVWEEPQMQETVESEDFNGLEADSSLYVSDAGMCLASCTSLV